MIGISSFGNEIRRIRQSKKLSLKDVTEKSGISHSYLSQIENGKRGTPKPNMIKKISKGLDVPYIELMNKAGYITTETDSLFEAFGLSPSEIKEVEGGGVISKGKGIHVDKVYLDYILKDEKIAVYYEGEIIPKDEKENINQLIRIHLKRR